MSLRLQLLTPEEVEECKRRLKARMEEYRRTHNG